MNVSPLVIGKTLLIPRGQHWPSHGWRAEVVISAQGMGDILIDEFVATREEATRMAAKTLLEAAQRYC